MTTLPVSDPRPSFLAAAHAAVAVANSVSAEQLNQSTPCSEFDVAGLLGHLVGVLRRAAAIGRNGDPMQVAVEGISAPIDGWSSLVSEAHRDVVAAWESADALDKTFTFPWVSQNGSDSLRMYTNEVVVHGWDLATAIGTSLMLPEAIAEESLAAIKIQLPLADRSALWEGFARSIGVDPASFEGPFANAVPVDENASALERVVAWNGRNPRWKP